jgi:asparagine synthase (glutamine-hydrolysing)
MDLLFPNTAFSDELKADYECKNVSKKSVLLFLKRNEFYGHLQKVLRKVDLMSMANSLEVRVPLLDKRILNFSNSVNPALGITHFNPKVILKNCLKQFIPDDQIHKEKKGFTIPIESWMLGKLKDELKQMLLDTPIYGAQHLNTTLLKRQTEDFLEGKTNSAWGLWHVYAWQKWAQENHLI